jgi:hypothetical protein
MIFKVKNIFLSVFCVLIVFFFSTCSAKNLQQTSESRKLKFEQVFAEQCVEKEIRNSVNKEEDRRRFSVPCSCIAKRIATDLSVPDAEKFLLEQKITHAFRMSFDEAAYFCVQQKKTPKSPALFGRK